MKFLLQKNNGEINVGLALTTRSILNHGGWCLCIRDSFISSFNWTSDWMLCIKKVNSSLIFVLFSTRHLEMLTFSLPVRKIYYICSYSICSKLLSTIYPNAINFEYITKTHFWYTPMVH
jgi:hypothetical protein